jgi:hypothetical protein
MINMKGKYTEKSCRLTAKLTGDAGAQQNCRPVQRIAI